MKNSIVPKAAFYSKSGVYILTNDRTSSVKRILVPLDPQSKAKHYPGIDTFSPAKISETLGFYNEIGLFKYDNRKSRKEERKTRKKASKSEKAKAIADLCNAPTMLDDQRSGCIVLLIALLAHVIHLLPQNMISGKPTVCCGNLLEVPQFLRTLLTAVNGPEIVRGSSYVLKRPSCLEPKRESPTSPAISLSPFDYLGGTLKMDGKKKYRFWLPLWSAPVCIAPNLPLPIQNCVENSPSVIPFYCNRAKDKDPWAITIPDNALYLADLTKLKKLKKRAPLIHAMIEAFLRNVAKHPKTFRKAFPTVKELYSHIHMDQLTVGSPTAEARVLVAAFYTFQCFLEYAAERGWITSDQCNSFLSAAQAALFPSKPYSGSKAVIGAWDSETAFWSFLPTFLTDNQSFIHTQRGRCPSDAVAAVHLLKGEKKNYLILPRFLVADAYRKYCTSYGLHDTWSDIELSHAIISWFPSLKREADNSGWQYNFYRKDDIPQGQKSAKLACLGFPLEMLPEDVQGTLPDITA